MPNDSNRPDVAVFIDFENVYVSVRDKLDANPNFEAIMERCEDFGRVVIARAYADWYRYPRVTSALYANGIEPMYVPTYYYDREMGRTGRPIKNSVDMNLCVEAMKTLYTNPNIAKFVLATGDRDFIPLVNTIRQQGKEVIVIGIGGAASAHLAQSADEFIFYESLVGKQARGTVDDVPRAKMPEKGRESYEPQDEAPAPTPRRERERDRDRDYSRSEAPASNGNGNGNGAVVPVPAPVAAESEQPDVYDTLVRAINLARERGYVCSFGSLKLLMKELMGGDFKESRYKDALGRPFAKFKDFVMEAERRGKVQVFTNGTVNEVFLPGEDPYKLSQFAAELKVDPEASPVNLEEEAPARAETRLGTAPNRRRRRRRRPGERSTNGNGDESEIEELEAEEFETASELELSDLPELLDENGANQIFEELLEQVEREDHEIDSLVDLAPEPILEPETSEIEDDAVEASASQTEVIESVAELLETSAEPANVFEVSDSMVEPLQTMTRPFDEQDWQFLRDVIAEYGRPASFAQVYDALRTARNRDNVGRTNEELRTMAKQAINSGMLARQGKGNRISYRLATPEEAEQEQTEQIEAMQANDPVQAAEDSSSSVLEALEDAAELASDPEQARAEVAEIQLEATAIAGEPEDSDVVGVAAFAPETDEEQAPKRRTRRRKPAQTEQAEAPVQVAETAAPKRGGRRRKPAQTEAAESSAETTPAEAAPARRTRRRKADTNDE